LAIIDFYTALQVCYDDDDDDDDAKWQHKYKTDNEANDDIKA